MLNELLECKLVYNEVAEADVSDLYDSLCYPIGYRVGDVSDYLRCAEQGGFE